MGHSEYLQCIIMSNINPGAQEKSETYNIFNVFRLYQLNRKFTKKIERRREDSVCKLTIYIQEKNHKPVSMILKTCAA